MHNCRLFHPYQVGVYNSTYNWIRGHALNGFSKGLYKALFFVGSREGSRSEGFTNLHHPLLGGGFKYCLFSSLFGDDSHFDYYFSIGLKPPSSLTSWKHGKKTVDEVSNITFPDFDLDETDVGGELTWSPASTIGRALVLI